MKDILWLQWILEELKLNSDVPMKHFCDNKAAISIAHNPVQQHDHTKHVEIDHHFIKEKLDNGIICIPFMPTKQLADALTKSLFRLKFGSIVIELGTPPSSWCTDVS